MSSSLCHLSLVNKSFEDATSCVSVHRIIPDKEVRDCTPSDPLGMKPSSLLPDTFRQALLD